jgi:hypothetical protein
MVIDLPFGLEEGKMCFEEDGQGLVNGRLFAKGEWRPLKLITLGEQEAELETTLPFGEAKLKLLYHGEQLSGVVASPMGERPFTATREP